MVGTHMPRVPSVDRGRRVDGCTWPGSGAGCVPTFSAPDGSPKPSPEWNPDAEVGGDYRIIRRRCVSGKAAIPGHDHRFDNTSAAAGSVKGLTRKWQCDVKRHIVTRRGELASRSGGGDGFQKFPSRPLKTSGDGSSTRAGVPALTPSPTSSTCSAAPGR